MKKKYRMTLPKRAEDIEAVMREVAELHPELDTGTMEAVKTLLDNLSFQVSELYQRVALLEEAFTVLCQLASCLTRMQLGEDVSNELTEVYQRLEELRRKLAREDQ